MDDPLIRTLFERCLDQPLDTSLRLLLADRLEKGALAPLAGALRQSLLQDEPVLLSGNVRRLCSPLEWAWDGWLGLDASVALETVGPGSPLLGAIRMRPWDEQLRMRLRLWAPPQAPAKLAMIPGGPLYPHLSEILRWKWWKRVSIFDLRSTYPGNVGMRALARSGGSLRLKVLDLRSNLLSAAALEPLVGWKGLESLECIDLRNNPGDFRQWAEQISRRPGRSAPTIRFDQNPAVNEPSTGLGQ